jgi:hypothetical protein
MVYITVIMAARIATAKTRKVSRKKKSRKAKENGDNLHVVPRIDGWAIRSERRTRPTSIHSSQHEAIDVARKLAKKTAATRLVIHGRDGRIKERETFAVVPLPPKEPRKVLYPSSSPNTSREAIRRAVSEAIRERGKDLAIA